MIDPLWLVPIGFAAGVLGSMVGIGGGILIVPILTFVGFPSTLAISNSLFATLSNAAASTIAYTRQGRVERSLGIKLGLAASPGTLVGAVISTDVTPSEFRILFGVMLVVSVIYMLVKRRMGGGRITESSLIIVLAVAASFFGGVISAFFGIGGGIVFVPLMVVVMGMGMKRAAPTSQMVLLFVSFSGVVSHTALGHPDFMQAGLLALGAFFGGLTGARVSLRVREGHLLFLILAVIMIAAVKFFIDAAAAAYA